MPGDYDPLDPDHDVPPEAADMAKEFKKLWESFRERRALHDRAGFLGVGIYFGGLTQEMLDWFEADDNQGPPDGNPNFELLGVN